MKDKKVTDSIYYIGANDKDLDLFESQYIIPNGISYNSYLIEDEKIVIMDTIDKRKTDEWISNLEGALKGKEPSYLVISHMEPDHAANIKLIAKKYPKMKLVGNKKTFELLHQFFEINTQEREVVVKEADTLNIGEHTLQFFMAPMVHWPEVMVTYEQTEKVLFSADGFGKFGSLDVDEDWTCEARRYYFNIVGRYGAQVQLLLKKAANLDIKIICPLHGPVLKENLEFYINKYDIWSSYKPEEEGILIAYNSVYGNTRCAVEKLAKILEEKGAKKIVVSDLARDDMAETLEDAFRYDKMVLACPTYDAGLFPDMEKFLRRLKHKNYQNRKIAIIENGSWAPAAAKCMKEIIEQMKDITLCQTQVTLKSSMKENNMEELNKLAEEILI